MPELQEDPRTKVFPTQRGTGFVLDNSGKHQSTRVRGLVPDRNRNGQYSAIVGCCPTCGAGLKNQQMRVDLDTNTFLIRGRCVYLRAKEAELLSVLVDRAPAVVTHGALTERLWGVNEPGDARKNIEVHVCRLRRAIAPVGASILNIYGIGYQFEAGEARHD